MMRVAVQGGPCRAALPTALPQHHAAGSSARAPGARVAESSKVEFRRNCRASSATQDAPATDSAPVQPRIKIDNTTDPFATIVKVDYGDKLGDLVDTIQALKNLGLNIRRAKLSEDTKNKFYVTDAVTSEKIVRSQKLEDIRQTILQNMKTFHPETGMSFSTSAFSGESSVDILHPLGADKMTVTQTKLVIEECGDSPFTKLIVTTQDRPGLLVDIVRTLKDCNINVLYAEIDTIGSEAQDEFLLSYRGEPLSSSMEMLVKNALQYYLSLAFIENVESY